MNWPKTWRDEDGNTYRQLYRMGAIIDDKGESVAHYGIESRNWLQDHSQFLTQIPDNEPDQTNYAGATERDWKAVSKPPICKIGIVGHGDHGKDEFANRLAKASGLRYIAGTSVYAAEFVWWMLRRRFEYARAYPNATACWADRRNHREDWARAIGEYNQDDPVRLYRDCLSFQDMLTGVRWRHEFEPCKEAGIVDLWVWVFDPRKPEDSTCEVTAADCDWVVANDAGLDELDRKAELLAMHIKELST